MHKCVCTVHQWFYVCVSNLLRITCQFATYRHGLVRTAAVNKSILIYVNGVHRRAAALERQHRRASAPSEASCRCVDYERMCVLCSTSSRDKHVKCAQCQSFNHIQIHISTRQYFNLMACRNADVRKSFAKEPKNRVQEAMAAGAKRERCCCRAGITEVRFRKDSSGCKIK